MNAALPSLDLAAALVVLPGPRAAIADGGGARTVRPPEARDLFEAGPLLLAHAGMTARRLGLHAPPRSAAIFDVLELFAFVRPARFCAPSAARARAGAGPARAQGGGGAGAGAAGRPPRPDRRAGRRPGAQPRGGAGAGRDFGPRRLGLGTGGHQRLRRRRRWDGPGAARGWMSGAVFTSGRTEAPPGEAASKPIDPAAAATRLAQLLQRAGLDEARPTQADFAAETAFAFQPREREGEPMMMLAEAGTGVGKTLGYLAPASIWAEANGPGVWISTYTRALQRQIERESHAVFPDPAIRARKAVVRKGRVIFLCLLKFQEAANAAQLGGGDLIGLVLAARWVRATRGNGDMTGGDFPAWLPTLFAISPQAQASAANLVDRRGECVHAQGENSHYRACFIEKAVRAIEQTRSGDRQPCAGADPGGLRRQPGPRAACGPTSRPPR